MDYDFITTCNWTSTGTYTLRAYRGSGTDVASSYTIYYRKKGASTWSSTTNGQISITSTGEWEVANDWNKSGNDCLTHSYYGITAIDKCTDVYFNEDTLGTTIGNYFLHFCWYGCTSLSSMPVGFNLPTGITTVGNYFLSLCWRDCTSLNSMPSGFNLPTGITSVGGDFLSYCWRNCTSLTSMPSGFNLPSGITSVGTYFLYYCWYDCTLLKADGYTEDIDFDYNSTDTFGGTCPIIPDSPRAGTSVAVNRPPEPYVTTQSCTDIAGTSVTGNGNIVGIGKASPTTRGICYKEGVRESLYATKAPGTMSIENRSGGDVNWINPDNAKTSDNTYSTVTLSSQSSHYLKATNFNFDIPTNATVKWVSVIIEAKTANGEVRIFAKTIKNGVYSTFGLGNLFNTTEETIKIGKWGTWTPSEINSSNFGAGICISSDVTDTISVDSIKIEVEYTMPDSVPNTGIPTIYDDKVYDTGSFGTGEFSKLITGLTPNTYYRVRAYATNSSGTGYGSTVTVKTLEDIKDNAIFFGMNF